MWRTPNLLLVLICICGSISFFSTTAVESETVSSKKTFWTKLFRLNKVTAAGSNKRSTRKMGQVMRTMTYDRAENEKNAIPALQIAGHALKWFRLDDGVMGGQSVTEHYCDKQAAPASTSSSTGEQEEQTKSAGTLYFAGTINTDGGGFTSIRAVLPDNIFSKTTVGLKLRIRGDGKTYKLLVSRGKGAGGPFAASPSWQIDLPTQDLIKTSNEGMKGTEEWQEVEIKFDQLKPSFGGPSKTTAAEMEKYVFNATEMKEIGFMLSLRLSDGSSNPKETFGEGIFPFQLQIALLEPLEESGAT